MCADNICAISFIHPKNMLLREFDWEGNMEYRHPVHPDSTVNFNPIYTQTLNTHHPFLWAIPNSVTEYSIPSPLRCNKQSWSKKLYEFLLELV